MMLSVVFPAFNEAQNLRRFPAEVFPVFESLGTPYEVVIVDDGSRDETAEVASSLGPKVVLVKHATNMGLGAAVRTGIASAHGDLIVTMDSDLTFAPSLVERLLSRYQQGDVDVVLGSPKLAGFGREIPFYRVGISKAATWVYSLALGFKVTAVSPIFRLYQRRDVQGLAIETNGFDVNAEILFKLVQRGKRIAEVAAPLTQRLYGESKLNYKKEVQHHLRLLRAVAKWRYQAAVGQVGA